MKMQKYSKALILVMLAIMHAAPAVADSSKEYAIRGNRAYNAFECSIIASVAGDKKLQEQLFALGMNEGKAFLTALETHKIQKDDLDAIVPIGLLFNLGGPSQDFMLGRIYQVAEENLSKRLYQKDGRMLSEEERKTLARDELSHRNCGLITGK